MKKQSQSYSNQAGSHVIIIVVAVAVLVFAAIIFRFVTAEGENPIKKAVSKVTEAVDGESKEPDLKIKHIGINLDYYDPATNKAGDIVFTKEGISQYDNMILMDYGLIGQKSSARPNPKPSPQPTFIVPLGTKIHAVTDGEVVAIQDLYSNDKSVHVASSKDSSWIYEMEHIINPTVKVGDKVKAGDVVGEASTHDSQYHPGFGLYEVGILHGGNPPEHVCFYNYLDESIKADTQKKLKAFYKSWEEYMGDTTIYDEAKMVVPGCYTLDATKD